MRAVVVPGVLAAALVLSACSGPPGPDPVAPPTTALGGFARDITRPDDGFAASLVLNVLGPEGEAVVYFTDDARLWYDGLDEGEWGLALVRRDGSREVVVEYGGALASEARPGVIAAISDDAVAFVLSLQREGGSLLNHSEDALFLWDRRTRATTRLGMTTNSGGHRGVAVAAPTLPFALSGSTAVWSGFASSDFEGSYPIIAANTAGDVWLPLDPDRRWGSVGVDDCAADGPEVVLWALEMEFGEHPGSTHWRFTVDAPGTASLDPASAISVSQEQHGFSFFVNAQRCGDAVAGFATQDGNARRGGVAFSAAAGKWFDIVPDTFGSSPPIGVSTTEEWLAYADIEGDDAHYWPLSALIHLPTRQWTTVTGGEWCSGATVRGEFVMWSVAGSPGTDTALDCVTYVGRLVAPHE